MFTLTSYALGDSSEDFQTQLPSIGGRVILPEWRVHTREYHPNGVPKSVIFYEDGEKGERLPVKQKNFLEDGNPSEEMDLILVDEQSPGYAVWKSTAVPHGVAFALHPNGQMKRFCQYDRGVLEGPYYSFFDTGKVRHAATYKQGKLHGKVRDYHSNGKVLAERYYQEGKLEGDCYRYYDSGQREAFFLYKNGVIEGKAIEWHPNGKERSSRNYREGKLESEKNQPAVIIYNEDHSIKEIQNFRDGQPHGSHVQYHTNNRKSYDARYENGQIEGKEQFFDMKGNLQGERIYAKGIKVGKHFKKHDNGNFSFLAQYDSKGKLKDKIRTFAKNGQKIGEYSYDSEEKFDGPFLTWYENGQPEMCYNYAHGELEGEQKHYFESGQIWILSHLIDRLAEGTQQVWHKNGQKASENKFIRGKLEGTATEWYENGKKKVEVQYKNGEKEGVHRAWNQEGALLVEGAYDRGKLVGAHTNFFPNGSKKNIVHFFQGKKQGSAEFYYENGQLESVQHYKEDLIDGELKYYFPDGSLSFLGAYKNGKPIGIHKVFYPSEQQKEGEKEDQEHLLVITHYNDEGQIDGERKFFYPSGAIKELASFSGGVLNGLQSNWDEKGNVVKEARYLNGNLEGRYLEKDADGRTIVYHYENNRKNGPHIIYYAEHLTEGKQVKSLEANFVNGRFEGKLLEYDLQGVQRAYTNYEAGVKNGAAVLYYPNGKPNSKFNFKQGKRDGVSQTFYPKGALLKEVIFSKDQKEGEEKTYFEKGHLKSVYRYEENQLNGLAQQWNESGVLIFEANYTKGKQNGRFVKFYDDGKPRLEHNYVEGKLEGMKKNWDTQGNLTEVFYKDGVKADLPQKS